LHFGVRGVGAGVSRRLLGLEHAHRAAVTREPLRIAFRSLNMDDPYLQGTALEYLESVLPQQIRQPLWPYLEDRRPVNRPARPHDEVLADLLRSNKSILINLEELKRRADAKASDADRRDKSDALPV